MAASTMALEAKEDSNARDINIVQEHTRADRCSIGPGDRPECFKSTIEEVLFVLTATMAVAMSSITTGATRVVANFIADDLKMTAAEITWITGACSLSSGAFLLFFGRVADLFGGKSLFIGSLFLYAVFALAAGFTKDPLTLIVLNGILGLMCASAVPPAQGMLGIIYEKPSKRKNAAFACFSTGNPLGFAFGTIFSAIAAQLFNWRASFWLLAIIYACFAVVALFTVPVDQTEKRKLSKDTIKRFDVLGSILMIAGVGMFSSSISLSGNGTHGWSTPYVVALLTAGVLSIVVFIFWELRFQYPLLPMHLWRDRNFSLAILILCSGFLAFPIGSFWMSLYMQQVLKLSAIGTAVRLLPMAIMGIIINVVAALLLHRVSNKLLMGIGAFSYVVSFVLMAVQRKGDSYWALAFPSFCLNVVGAELEFNVTNMYVMSSMSKDQQAIAGGIFQTVTRLCVTISLGVSTAIFSSIQKTPARSGYYANDPIEPYAATFWFAAAIAAVGGIFVPFLTISTQGHSSLDKQTLNSNSGNKLEKDT